MYDVVRDRKTTPNSIEVRRHLYCAAICY